jgi:hypothetical protein
MNEKNKLVIELAESTEPLPRVTVITVLTDPVMFQFALYSWNSLVYPSDLLNWIIYDPKKLINKTSGDPRVRFIQNFKGSYNQMVENAMRLEWYEGPVPTRDSQRTRVFMSMNCGDVMTPDNLVIKHKALTQHKKKCVIPLSLAYYNPAKNSALIGKFFQELPRSGLYWKKDFWARQQSHEMVGVAYIGNCVCIGDFPFPMGTIEKSSIKLYDNFPPEVKTLLRMMIYSDEPKTKERGVEEEKKVDEVNTEEPKKESDVKDSEKETNDVCDTASN